MDDEPTRSRLSRRRVLSVLGAASVAGCVGSEADQRATPTDRSTPPTQTTSERATTATPTATPVTAQYDLGVGHDIEAWDAYEPSWRAPTDAAPVDSLKTEVLVENLEIPWDLSFAPDGTLFITERVGRVRTFDGDSTSVLFETEASIDAESVDPGGSHDSWWIEGGEGGTLGIAAHPNYPEVPLVYVYYTTTADGKHNRVVAFDVTAEDPSVGSTVIVDDIPADAVHNGGRLTFGPENYLWVTCGDAGTAEKAQDPGTLHGTVLRVTATGEPAPGNPFVDGGGDSRVFTYGHRNPQGVVFLPDGTPLATEHGPDGRDECNRLEAGANYGWPHTRNREAYLDAPDVHRPLANSGEPSWAPTGALFYTGDAVPGLMNRLLVGGLWSQQLLVATVTPPDGALPPVGEGTRYDHAWTDDAYTVTTQPALQDELGRIRHVEQGPDGALYAITSNRDGRATEPFPREGDDVLVRLTEA